MDPSTMLGPLDSLAPYIEEILLVLVVFNLFTRLLDHRRHRRQAEEGPEAVSRSLVHEASTVALLLGSFYYLTVHPHGGMVLSTLVVGMVIADFFEFEARKVEVRTEKPLERPKGALVASMLVLLYVLYQVAFFIIKPIWQNIV